MDAHRSRDVLDPVLHDIADARNYNDWLFSRAQPYLGRSVLDVGAGVGTFTERAADAGADVTAVEPEFGALLREQLGDRPEVTVREQPLEELPAASFRTFDRLVPVVRHSTGFGCRSDSPCGPSRAALAATEAEHAQEQTREDRL